MVCSHRNNYVSLNPLVSSWQMKKIDLYMSTNNNRHDMINTTMIPDLDGSHHFIVLLTNTHCHSSVLKLEWALAVGHTKEITYSWKYLQNWNYVIGCLDAADLKLLLWHKVNCNNPLMPRRISNIPRQQKAIVIIPKSFCRNLIYILSTIYATQF